MRAPSLVRRQRLRPIREPHKMESCHLNLCRSSGSARCASMRQPRCRGDRPRPSPMERKTRFLSESGIRWSADTAFSANHVGTFSKRRIHDRASRWKDVSRSGDALPHRPPGIPALRVLRRYSCRRPLQTLHGNNRKYSIEMQMVSFRGTHIPNIDRSYFRQRKRSILRRESMQSNPRKTTYIPR